MRIQELVYYATNQNNYGRIIVDVADIFKKKDTEIISVFDKMQTFIMTSVSNPLLTYDKDKESDSIFSYLFIRKDQDIIKGKIEILQSIVTMIYKSLSYKETIDTNAIKNLQSQGYIDDDINNTNKTKDCIKYMLLKLHKTQRGKIFKENLSLEKYEYIAIHCKFFIEMNCAMMAFFMKKSEKKNNSDTELSTMNIAFNLVNACLKIIYNFSIDKIDLFANKDNHNFIKNKYDNESIFQIEKIISENDYELHRKSIIDMVFYNCKSQKEILDIQCSGDEACGCCILCLCMIKTLDYNEICKLIIPFSETPSSLKTPSSHEILKTHVIPLKLDLKANIKYIVYAGLVFFIVIFLSALIILKAKNHKIKQLLLISNPTERRV